MRKPTSNERRATEALLAACLRNMGGKTIEDLEADPFTWVDPSDLVKAGWTAPSANATFGALEKAGVVYEEEENFETGARQWVLDLETAKQILG